MGLHQDICVKSEKVSDVEEFLEGFSGFFRVEYKGGLFVISSEAGAAIGLGVCKEDFGLRSNRSGECVEFLGIFRG